MTDQKQQSKVAFAEVRFRNDKISDPLPMDVYVRLNRNAESDQDVADFLEQLSLIFTKNREFMIFYDASRVDNASLSQLMQMKKFLQKYEKDGDRLTKACTVCFGNDIVEGLVKTVLFFKHFDFPLKITAKEGDSKAWLQEQAALHHERTKKGQ